MAFVIQPDEPVYAAMIRIVQEEVEAAAGQLEGSGEPTRDEAIHEARKNIKKTRAVLKLMRGDLGKYYAVENQRFRELGRKLSEFRDAGAMVEVFDQMREIYEREWGSGLESIRQRLLEEKAEKESTGGIGEVLTAAVQELRSVDEQVKQWPLRRDGFRAVAPGLERTYRDGRTAMQAANANPTAECFHNWRKRAKAHWYHVRLLSKVSGNALEFYQKDLKVLERYLGDDHNLAVLRNRIEDSPHAYGGGPEVSLFLQSVDKQQVKLRASAQFLGADIYKDKPRVFVNQMGAIWKGMFKDRERMVSTLPVTG